MNTPPASDLGRAISLLRLGARLPQSLTDSLRDQGHDVIGLHQAYLNKKN